MGKMLWVVLGLLSSQLCCSWAQFIELAPIPCNDRNVEKLSKLAITYINEDRTSGYKFALNRVSNVHLHAQGPAGNVFYLDLDVLETKCHIRSPRAWKRCAVRPFMETQISGNCNTTILHTPEGFSYLYSYECTLVPDAPEKLLQKCPDCPLLLPVDSPQAVTAARLALRRHNAQSTLPYQLALLNITRAASQNAPVQASFVEYTVGACPEGHMYFGMDTCVPNMLQAPVGFCTGSVFGDPQGQADIQVSCEMFDQQVVDIAAPLQPQVHVPRGDTFDTSIDPKPAPPAIPSPPKPAPPAIPSPPKPAPPAIPSLPKPAPPAIPSLPKPAPLGPNGAWPYNPTVLVNPNPPYPKLGRPLTSSESSEESSEEIRRIVIPTPRQIPTPKQQSVSSSEEIGGAVARPPSNFRYVRPVRRRRQAPVPPPARRAAHWSSSESNELFQSHESHSSSEELGGAVVRRPVNFRYVRPVRRRRQALATSQPTHSPTFMAEFPAGTSPFRSCPGPSRYTTV